MKKKIKQFLSILLGLVLLSSCNVTFPKETLEKDIKLLIQKNVGVESVVTVCGSTLYLDVKLEDIANNTKQEQDTIKILQEIVSSVARVPLSSDKEINIVVVSVFDVDYANLLRIFENIDDIKKYSYHYMSRTEYIERQLMEAESGPTAQDLVEKKYDISLEEYVARLTASKINNSSLVRQILSKLEKNLDLKFSHYDVDTIYFKTTNIDDSKMMILIEKILENELVKNLQKYKIFSVKSAILLDGINNVVFNINLK